jgi:hypothetical protein
MIRTRGVVGLFLLLSCVARTSSAALFGRTGGSGNGNSKIALRKRLHVNTLITEPGTMEVDWSSLYSFSTSNFTTPSGIRYTPEGSNVLWGRTEYSVAFDSVSSANVGGTRLTQFSQAVTLTATSVIHDGEKFDFAIAPQATVFLRDESGSRLGAVAIARYDTGRNSIGGTVSWSTATHVSPSNPAGTVDVGFGFGRQLSGSPLLEKFTPHMNAEWERSTGLPRALLASEGVEYQITERLAFDVSGQQATGAGNPSDHQIAFGFTLNVGRLR